MNTLIDDFSTWWTRSLMANRFTGMHSTVQNFITYVFTLQIGATFGHFTGLPARASAADKINHGHIFDD